MTNRIKVTKYILGAVLILALVLTMAFALIPSSSLIANADDWIEIDTNTLQYSYTKDNVTVTVIDVGDEDGAGVRTGDTMTVSVTGDYMITRIKIYIGYYWNYNTSLTFTAGEAGNRVNTLNGTGNLIVSNINLKTVVIDTIKSDPVMINHISVELMPVNVVLYNLDGGIFNGAYIDYYGDNKGLTLPTNVTKNEYVFAGWYDNANFENDPVTSIATSETGDKEFWARWNPIITYNTNGGAIQGEYPTVFVTGVGTILPTTVTKEGFAFVGWWNNEDFLGDAVTTIGTDILTPQTYWARWYPSITYNLFGGAIEGDYPTYFVPGVGATLPTNVTQEGCTFMGWYDNANFDGDPVTDIDTEAVDGKEFWAKWNCPITLNTNGGTINSGDVTEYIAGVGVTLPTDLTKGELFFSGWYNNDEFNGNPVTAIGIDENGVKEFWAKWVTHLHNYSELAFDDTNHWYVCTATIGECDAPVLEGEAHIYSDSADTEAYFTCSVCGYVNESRKSAYYLADLSVDLKTYDKTTIKRNVTVNVESTTNWGGALIGHGYKITITLTGNYVFNEIQFNVGSYYDDGHSSFRISSGNKYYDSGSGHEGVIKVNNINTKKVIVDTPYEYLRFTDLIIKSKAVNGVTYELNGAAFNGDYIDYYFNNQGLTLPTNVTKDGNVFKGWYDNAEFTGEPITAIPTGVSGNKTVYAKWNPTITYNLNDGEIEGEYPTDYALGVGATLPTTVTKEGYSFGGWWDNEIFTGNPITTITTEDTEPKTYWARWYAIGYYVVGNITENKVKEGYLMTQNTAVSPVNEYYIDLKLQENDSFKVIYGTVVYGENGRMDNIYPESNVWNIGEDGWYRISVRPDGDGSEGWLDNILYAKRLYAKTGETNYYSLADAYVAASENATIKLIDDVDLRSATQLVVTKNVTLDLSGFILDITTVDNPTIADFKLVASEGAVITLTDTNETIGGVKGMCYPDAASGSYIILSNCRLTMNALLVRQNLVINHKVAGYVVRNIDEAPDADGFITIVRVGTNEEIAADVDELIGFIGEVQATIASKTLINTARNEYEALNNDQKELVEHLDILETAESTYITLLGQTINALPAVGVLVYEDKDAVENARALYEALRASEKEAFSADTLAVLVNAEADIEELKKAKAVENIIEALPATILFEHNNDVARARVRYDALTEYQQGKVPAATYSKLQAAEAEIADWTTAMIVVSQIEALPATAKITIENKTRIEAVREAYEALGELKNKVTQATVDKLVAVENAWAVVKADSDIADVVEAAIAAIGKLERSDTCLNKIQNAREQYNDLTEAQKALVDNYYTLVTSETRYAAYINAADSVDNLINAIGEVTNNDECAEKINDARTAFDALTIDQKEFVTKYATLEAAESTYAAFSANDKVAKIGDNEYTTFIAACTAARKNQIVKLLTDIDLTGEDAAYITLRRDITIDLNGHVLNVTTGPMTYIVWASDGAIITIDNSVPGKGGLKGLIGADYLSGAKIILHNCRLTLSELEFSEYNAFLFLDTDCVIKNLNSGKSGISGYVSDVHPYGDQDIAADVDDLIKAIDEIIELTDECGLKISVAREAYDELTNEQKAFVEYLAMLQDAESNYTALAVAEIEALIDDDITIGDRLNVQAASTIYNALTNAEKALVPVATLTKLTQAEETIATLMSTYSYTSNPDECMHNLIKMTNFTKSTNALKDYVFADEDVMDGSIGVRVNFPRGDGRKMTVGNVIVTFTVDLEEARWIEVGWKFEFQSGYHTCIVTITHNSDSPVNYNPSDYSWHIDRFYCEAGVNSFSYKCQTNSTSWAEIEQGRNFYVVPMWINMFDENNICKLCGDTCLHEKFDIKHSKDPDEYYFICYDKCHKKIELSKIPFDQETSFVFAREAYDALSDEQKAKFRPSDLFDLESHESIKAVLTIEQSAVLDAKVALEASNLINGLPEATAVTLKDVVAIQAARTAYDALTEAQLAYVASATVARLTAVEEKYAQIRAEADAQETDDVVALINALPNVDDITFENRSLIEQARAAYEMLTEEQKDNITNETMEVLSAAELKGIIVSWEDVFPEDGTYIFVSEADNTKALIRIDANTIKIATYDEATINNNDPDVVEANNRDFKWEVVRRGSKVYYTIINCFYTGNTSNRLLDVNGDENDLTDGSDLSLNSIGKTMSEYETDVFRFSKRKGVDMEEDEYYIRSVSEANNLYNLMLTLRTGDSVNIGTYGVKNANQVWKLVRVKGDDDFVKEVKDQIALLPTYDNTTLAYEDDIIAARAAYSALTNYQKNLVGTTSLAYLESAEQKIVDIKAANAVDAEINAIGEVTDSTESKNKIDTARTHYNALTENQKALVQNLDTLVAAEATCAGYVTAVIEALSAGENITTEDATAIAAARTKYNALTAEEKLHVTAATVNKLLAAEMILQIIQLPVGAGIEANNTSIDAARVAFNSYNTWLEENVGLDDLIPQSTKDTLIAAEMTLSIVKLPAIENITIDNTEAVSTIMTAYNGMSNAQKAKVFINAYNKLRAEDTTITIINLPAFADLTLDNAAAVATANSSYANYNSWVEENDGQENMLLVGTVETLTLALQKIADMTAAKAVDDKIDLIGEVVYTDSKESIDNARAAYEALTEAQVEFVTKLETLIAAEIAYAGFADVDINNSIDMDVNEITLEDKDKVLEAKAIYDNLSEEEKDHITSNTVSKLTTALLTIDILEITDAAEVDGYIDVDKRTAIINAKTKYDNLTTDEKNLLSDNVIDKVLSSATAVAIYDLPAVGVLTLDDKADVQDVRTQFEAMSDAGKAKVPVETLAKLVAAEKEITDIEQSNAVTATITALPVVGELTLDDKADVVAARTAYYVLSTEGKAKVSGETIAKLEAAETEIADIEAAKAVTDAVIALPAVGVQDVAVITTDYLTLDNKAAVNAARTAYEELTTYQKGKVIAETLNILAAAETEITNLEAAKAVYDSIVALPAIANITANDSEDVATVMAAYTALSDYQQGKVPADLENKLYVEETVTIILSLPAIEDLSLGNKIAVDNADGYFDALTDDQEALVPSSVVEILEAAKQKIVDMTAAKAVDDKIDLIGEVTYDDEIKEKIDNARAAYNALTEAQKAFVTKLETLTDAETTYAGLADTDINNIINMEVKEITISDKDKVLEAKAVYDNLTDEEKDYLDQDTVTKLTTALLTIDILEITDAANIDGNIDADKKTAIIIAKTKYDNLTTDEKNLLSDDVKDKVLSSTTALAIYDLPAVGVLTLDDKTNVQNVRAQYEALSEAGKNKVPAGTLAKLVAAEKEITDIEESNVATAAITDLPAVDNLTLDNKAAVTAARTKYNALSTEGKAKVSTETLAKLVAAEKEITDIEQSNATTEAITALPAVGVLTLDNKTAVTDARVAYNALSPEGKAKVSDETLAILVAAEKEITDIEESNATTEAITALPVVGVLTLENKAAVVAARAAYIALSPEGKAKVSDVTLAILVAAETEILDIEQSNAVTARINALPPVADITLDDEEEIVATRADYTALSDAGKAKVTDETLAILVAAEKKIDDIKAANAFIEKMNAIGEVAYDETSKNAIEEARNAYNALSPEAQDLINSIETLTNAEATYANLATESIDDLIDFNVEDITLDNKDDIIAARAEYEALSPEEKAKVPAETLDKLKAAEKEITDIEESNATDDTIEALPVVGVLTLDDKDDVISAREQYEALSPEGKAKVPTEVLDKLKAAEKEITDIEESNATDESIEELPVVGVLTLDDKDDVISAREQYEALSPEGKAKVPAAVLEKLEAAEKEIIDIEESNATDESIEELPVVGVLTLDDKDDVISAREQYEALSPEGKTKVPAETLAILVAAEKEITDIEESNATDDTIEELPVVGVLTLEDKEDVIAAREQYDALSPEGKAKVPTEVLDKLKAAEKEITDIEESNATDESIDNLPVVGVLTLEDKDDVIVAREQYEALSPEGKAKVSAETIAILVAAEKEIVDIEESDAANETIDELPVVGVLMLKDKNEVIEARAEYEALSPEGKAKVPAVILAKLEAAEKEIVDIEAALDVDEIIEELPEVSAITREDQEAVVAAREAYDALTEYQKGKVPSEILAKLVAAENIYVAMEKIEAIGEVSYTSESKTLIDEAKEYYDALSDDQKVAIDNAEQLQKANTDYYAVDSVVNQINSISDISYDERSNEAITTARQAYASLTAEQKLLLGGGSNSLQTLVNAETVYETLGKIDAIGKVEYSEESKELIDEARQYYDSLTDEQKALVSSNDYETLTVSEEKYTAKDSGAKATYTTLLVIVGILLAAGLLIIAGMAYLLMKGKKKGTKTLSVVLLPVLLGATHYVDKPFVALYILIGLLVVVLAVIIKLAIKYPNLLKELKNIFKKEAEVEAPAEEVKEEESVVNAAVDTENEEEEVLVVDAKGNIFNIRYNKSFLAKLSQSPDETKQYYTALKNEVLAYNKTRSSVSWSYDSVNSGRSQVVKFAIRGKTLCVYFALNADDYADSKYKVEKVDSKKYEDVPCLYRIKNDRRLGYAKDLIAVVCEKLGLTKGEVPTENYALPYETTKALIEKGLIKELKVAATDEQIERAKAEGKIELVEEVATTTTENDEEEEVLVVDVKGNIFNIRYNKSFLAKLSQSPDETKQYYTALKNEVLAYNKTRSSVSWSYDSVNSGRSQVVKFAIRGKTLCVYFALNADDYADSKYKVEKVDSRKYEDVPCMYRIKNDRRLGYAKDLIATVCEKLGLTKGEVPTEDYALPYETTEALIEKGLIKELKVAATDAQIERAKAEGKIQYVAQVSVKEADAMISDEIAATMIEGRSGNAVGKKEIINVDILSKNYVDGDTVTIESLKAKKLVPASAKQVKLLARGTLDKKLNVELQDYSIEAVKMIIATGGTVKKV